MDLLGSDTVNALRSIVTLLGFVAFIGIVLWAWSGARHSKFAEAARIPFEGGGVQDKIEMQNLDETKRTRTGKIGTERTNTEKADTAKTDAERSSK